MAVTRTKKLPNRKEAVQPGSLRPFKVEPAKKRGYLKVTCGHCGDTHWVRRSWLTSRDHIGRPCPYCFKTGLAPKEGR